MATKIPLIISGGQIQRIQVGDTIDPLYVVGAVGTFTLTEVSIPFTDGDTMRRVTVVDALVTVASKIDGTIRRPDTVDDSADLGFLYVANVVKIAAGSFDLLVACLAWGADDSVELPPNETIKFVYSIA